MTDRRVDDAVDAVQAFCTPDQMSKTDAIDFLEEVIARLQTSIEALQDEIENRTDEDES